MTVVLSVLPSSVTLEHVEALQSCIVLLLQSPLGGVVVVTFGKTAVLSVLLMTTVLSVLPSSPVTLEHVEALQSYNRIITAVTARWRGSSNFC